MVISVYWPVLWILYVLGTARLFLPEPITLRLTSTSCLSSWHVSPSLHVSSARLSTAYRYTEFSFTSLYCSVSSCFFQTAVFHYLLHYLLFTNYNWCSSFQLCELQFTSCNILIYLIIPLIDFLTDLSFIHHRNSLRMGTSQGMLLTAVLQENGWLTG